MNVGEEVTADKIAALLRKERADKRQRVRALVRMATDGDAEGFMAMLSLAYNNEELGAGLRAIGRIPAVPSTIREVALQAWFQYGDGWRSRAGSDRDLARALRVLLLGAVAVVKRFPQKAHICP